ncbi:PREDICTED: uncharacterized protein LOC108748827 [Trachymyrmex septentrionalis]|uniref:uncharacterized protein LOC108748827 n=1 Tax=Trachymyrmex septentrionalis TaxID=34720 RepID=UPI00084F7F70|nr:PREDICTED: uncharacterized protein LOC108748827 [Trachymyrmex septentrionalis]
MTVAIKQPTQTKKSIAAAVAEAKPDKCLIKGGHNVESCSSSTCRLCHKKHNTLLHIQRGEGANHGSDYQITTIKSSQSHKTQGIKLAFSILPEITVNLPLSEINKKNLQIETITLADPSLHTPEKRDILLGSSIFWETIVLCIGQIKLGKVRNSTENKTRVDHRGSSRPPKIDGELDRIQRFWKVEESPIQSELSDNDKICEAEFIQTHKRNLDGRFEVRLCDSVDQLGDHTRDIAIKNFFSSEESQTSIYLPHHAVLKPDSITTKLRVVFDASCPTSSGVSLNNIFRSGPTIQQNLFSVTMRFRQHRFVITADIKQMYRQVLVQEDQGDLQRIV